MKEVSSLAIVLAFLTIANPILGEFLRTGGSNFYYGNDKVFLSGANFAWNAYGYDFGDGQYSAVSEPVFQDWINRIRANGGNTARVWVHVEGFFIPHWDEFGYPVSPDVTGTFINDLGRFLDYAYDHEVFIILVLWNGALMRNDLYKNLVWDDSRAQVYIDNVVIPTVRELKGKPSLAAWEIFNEPDGLIRIEADPNPCFDTMHLLGSGAGWAGAEVPLYRLLRFINWVSAAIHSEDPKALVTTGTGEKLNTDNFGYRNHFKDSCLIDAGGKPTGILDFYQLHAYSWEGAWMENSPFTIDRWAYDTWDKPLIIGEFAEACSQGEGIERLFDWCYTKGYSGALVWQYYEPGGCADIHEVKEQGMRYLRDRNDQSDGNGGLVNVDIRY